jgi:molybdate transport system permease protein
MIDLNPFLLTLELAISTTVVLLLLAVPLAHWLAFNKSYIKTIIEVIVSMPLVLPPTVIGFYLLVVFSPGSFLGTMIEKWLHIRLVFSFWGLLCGSVIYSLPFMVHPIETGLAALPQSLREASFSLGKNKWSTLRRVLLPNVKTSLLTGIILTFAHTVGEFGVVLMIGGNIPGKTRVASVAIYDEVEALNYTNANMYAGILLFISFTILLVLYGFTRRRQSTRII